MTHVETCEATHSWRTPLMKQPSCFFLLKPLFKDPRRQRPSFQNTKSMQPIDKHDKQTIMLTIVKASLATTAKSKRHERKKEVSTVHGINVSLSQQSGSSYTD